MSDSATKNRVLHPTSFLSLTIQSNNGNANNSNNNPNPNPTQNTTNPNSHKNPLTFNITKAYIKESLSSLFEIHCEGYIENLSSHPFSEFSTNNAFNNNQNPNQYANDYVSPNTNTNSNLNNPNNIANNTNNHSNPNNHLNNQTRNNPNNLNFHPNALIDSFAIFSITNPYPNNNNTLSFANELDSALSHSKTQTPNALNKLDSNHSNTLHFNANNSLNPSNAF